MIDVRVPNRRQRNPRRGQRRNRARMRLEARLQRRCWWPLDEALAILRTEQIFDVGPDEGTVAVFDDDGLAGGGGNVVKLRAPRPGNAGVRARRWMAIDPRT
jgi:hypothetical protein